MVDILLTTFNRVEFLKKTLLSLFKNTEDVKYRLFIIDDGSMDGTVEYLSQLKHEKLSGIVLNRTRRGLRYSFNLLWSYAMVEEESVNQYPLMCYLQDDVEILKEGWLSLLVKAYYELKQEYSLGFFSGYDCPEHPIKKQMQWSGIPVFMKASTAGQNLIAEKSFWSSVGTLPGKNPDGTLPGLPDQGRGSNMDVWFTGCGPGSAFNQGAASPHSSYSQGKTVMVMRFMKHLGQYHDSVWDASRQGPHRDATRPKRDFPVPVYSKPRPGTIKIPQIDYGTFGEPIKSFKEVTVPGNGYPFAKGTSQTSTPKWQIITTGGSIFGERMSKILGMDFSSKIDRKYDGAILVDIQHESMRECYSHKGVPKICYWIGSDGRRVINEKENLDFGEVLHIMDSPWLASFMGEKIKQTYFVPMPYHLPIESMSYPEEPGILFYLSVHPARNIERCKAVIRAITDVPIYVIKSNGTGVIDKNFQNNVFVFDRLTDQARIDLFKKVSLYVRLMHWDQLSQLVIEMKVLGKHVLYTSPAPYCKFVKPEDSTEAIVKMIRERLPVLPDGRGSIWYRQFFSKEQFLRSIRTLCEQKKWRF